MALTKIKLNSLDTNIKTAFVENVDFTTANIIENNNVFFTNTRVVSALVQGNNITIEANGRVSSAESPALFYTNTLTPVTGNNALGTQNILGVGVTLLSNTLYEFHGNFNLYKSVGGTSHTFSFGWGGNATLNKILTNLLAQQSQIGFVTFHASRVVNMYTMENKDSMIISSAITNTFYTINIQIQGIVSVATGGTLIPQYTLSAAPGGAYTTSAGSTFSLRPLGTAASPFSVGTWS
jgi:hypothetical protein